MSSRPKRGPSLFEAAGLDADAPRPLADKLRPTKLAEVVGQDHLLGPDGALTRMLDTRTLGSLIFWGPPGTGKTTVARLLADATAMHFEQISAIFSGVADLKKVFDAARAHDRHVALVGRSMVRNMGIARDLGLTEGTVKIHIAAILRSLGASNRTEAVVRARELGLLQG